MPMTLAQRKALFYARRDQLMALLGNVCAEPGCESWDRLEFDHPYGRNYDIRRLCRWQRMKRYMADYLAGNLRLLCAVHNGRDGARRRWAARGRGR